MEALGWKLATCVCLTAAVFLAVHEPRTSAAAEKTAETRAARPRPSVGSRLFSFATAAPESPVPHLATELRGARTPAAACRLMTTLGKIGSDDAVGAIADAARTRSAEARICAASSLGLSGTALARGHLAELATDRDPQVRRAAMSELAGNEEAEARSFVLDAARGEDPAIRIDALVALGRARTREGLPLLIAASSTLRGEALYEVIDALGEMGDETAVPALSRLFEHPSAGARHGAVGALGKIGGEAAVAALSHTLDEARGDEITVVTAALAAIHDGGGKKTLFAATAHDRREVSRAALAALVDVEGDDVRDLFLDRLSVRDPEIFDAVCNYFANRHDEAAIPKLSEVARRGSAQNAGRAVAALAYLGGDVARKDLFELATTPGPARIAAMEAVGSLPGEEDRARSLYLGALSEGGQLARTAISHLGDDPSPEARAALTDLLRTTGPLAMDAARLLGGRRDPESCRAVIGAFHAAKEPYLRNQLLSIVGEMPGDEPARLLASALRDEDAGVREAAISAVVTRGGEPADRAVTAAAASNDESERRNAVLLLRRLDTQRSRETLARLSSDPDANIAGQALSALSAVDPERAEPLIRRAVAQGGDTRLIALESAGSLDAAVAIPLLSSAVTDSDSTVAETALRQLSQLGGPEAERALVDTLYRRDAPLSLQMYAASVLEDQGGAPARQNQSRIEALRATASED
jgi:HEAT repeat protein